MDIVSPGGVCKGITPENFGTVSITRNSLVVNMFYRIGYIEQMGTGIMRIKEAAKEANVAEPKFELSGFFKVTFRRNEIDASSGRKRLQAVVPPDRKRAVIEFLEEWGQTKTPDFNDITGLSDSRVRALLRDMVRDGTIEKVGDNRYAYYVLKQ